MVRDLVIKSYFERLNEPGYYEEETMKTGHDGYLQILEELSPGGLSKWALIAPEDTKRFTLGEKGF